MIQEVTPNVWIEGLVNNTTVSTQGVTRSFEDTFQNIALLRQR
jgi:hypothetical protein